MTSENNLTFLSTFTGVGGFDIGFERAGMRCIGQCEIDHFANMVLDYRWPETMRASDVRKINESTFTFPNVICGGFPCQDLSVAGKRAGLAGRRSGLYFDFERIVAQYEPAWFVIENVPGLLSSNGKRDFATIVRRLGQCGYLQAWRVLDSQYFGVPQRRRRVYIVGSLGNGRCAEVLFEREGVPGNYPPRRKTGQGFAADLAPCLASSGRGIERPGESRGQDPVIAVAKTVNSKWANGGGAHCRNIAGQFDVRRLTPRECERLQGFPDDWTRHGIDRGRKVEVSDSQRYKMLGNAVTVTVAEWIGRRIVRADQL